MLLWHAGILGEAWVLFNPSFEGEPKLSIRLFPLMTSVFQDSGVYFAHVDCLLSKLPGNSIAMFLPGKNGRAVHRFAA